MKKKFPTTGTNILLILICCLPKKKTFYGALLQKYHLLTDIEIVLIAQIIRKLLSVEVLTNQKRLKPTENRAFVKKNQSEKFRFN